MPVSGFAARRVFLIPNFLPRLTSLAGERSPVFLTARLRPSAVRGIQTFPA